MHSIRLLPTIFLAFLVLVSPPPALSETEADTQQIPQPQPPFVKTPPPGVAWSVEVSTSTISVNANSVQPARPPRPARLDMVVGTNNVATGIVTQGSETQGQYYTINGHILQRAANTAKVYVMAPQGADPFNLVTISFPAVDWLSLKNYVGIEMLAKAICYKFHIPPGTQADPFAFNGERTAWIRTTDGYPVKVQLDNIVFTFSEVLPFSKPVDLPSDYKAFLDEQARKDRVLELLRNH